MIKNCELLRFGSDHPWGQRKNPPGDLSCAQGSLWSSCSVRRTRLIEETWRCPGVEWGGGKQSWACILSIFPSTFISSVPAPTVPKGRLFSPPWFLLTCLTTFQKRGQEPRLPA